MKGFGGLSAGHGPLPSPSSSSTLSPLAPPFTVDRSVLKPNRPPSSTKHHDAYDYAPMPASDNWLRPHPPTSSPSPTLAPPDMFPRLDPASDSVHYFGPWPNPISRSLSSTLVQAEPYYPHYSSAAAVGGGMSNLDDDHLEGSFSGFGGYPKRHVGPGNRPCDVESGRAAMGVDGSSSWMEPSRSGLVSSYEVPFSQGLDRKVDSRFLARRGVWHGKHVDSLERKVQFEPECPVWVDDNTPAYLGENTGGPFNLSRKSPLGLNAVVEGMNYLHLPDSVVSVGAFSTLNSNSSPYDRYIAQFDLFKTDPMVSHPATTYSSSAQVFDLSASRTSTSTASIMSKNVNSFQHVDAYKYSEKYGGHISAKLKEPSNNLIAEGKKGYADNRTLSSDVENGESISANYSLGKRNLPSSLESPIRISMKYPSENKLELKIANLNCSNACTFAPSSAEDDSKRSSCETIDQLNLAVDSPCWKGVSASRHSPFCVDETADVNSISAYQKYDDAKKTGLDCSNVGNGKAAQYADGLEKQKKEVTLLNDPKSSSKSKDYDAVPLIQEVSDTSATQLVSTTTTALPETSPTGPNQNGSPDFYSVSKDQVLNLSSSGIVVTNEIVQPLGASDPSSTYSPRGIDIQLLVKTIHNLSELLLSSYYGGANVLKERDHEILQLAVVNLEKIGLQRTKLESFPPFDSMFCNRKSFASCEGTPKGRFEVKGLGVDDVMKQSNNKSSYDWQAKLHSIRSSMYCDKFHDFVSIKGDTNLKKDNYMTQVLEKVLIENFHEDGDNSQIILYKNLWVEAEVALCALKYELELARMKIVMENHKQQQTKDSSGSSYSEGKPAKMTTLSSLDTMHDPDTESPPIDEESLPKNVSAAVKDRSQESYLKPPETIQSSKNNTEEIDASVMARFRVLKGRIDRQNSVGLEEKQKLPESVDVGVNAGIKEKVCSPCCSANELNVGMKHQPIPFDLTSAVWRNTWMCSGGGPEDQGLEAQSDVQHLVPNYYEGIDLESSISGEHHVSREVSVRTADRPPNLPYTSSNLPGKRFLGGSDSPSSDWEHVLKDELTW